MAKCNYCDQEAEWDDIAYKYCQEHWKDHCDEAWHVAVANLNQTEGYRDRISSVVSTGFRNLYKILARKINIRETRTPVHTDCTDCRYFDSQALKFIHSGCAVNPHNPNLKICREFKQKSKREAD